MRRMILFCFVSILLPSFLLAQAPTKPSFMNAAVVQHNGAVASVTANSPRPLMQAVEAIGQEYGWLVDYEDPPYVSHFDLVDDTDPKWRASHPSGRAATRVSGGLFQSNLPEPSSIASGDAAEQVLQVLVTGYNSSGNPGKFAVRKQAGGRYTVVGAARKDENGQDEAVNAILDTPITIPVQQRDAEETLQLILDTLTAKSGIKVYLGTVSLSSNPLQDATVTIGGSDIPSRVMLSQALDQISGSSPHFRHVFVWNFLFDSDLNRYWLRLRTATKTVTDSNGQQTVEFIDYPRN
jgi:hypothetical protein